MSEIFREVPGALGHGLVGLPYAKLRKSVKACSDFFYKMYTLPCKARPAYFIAALPTHALLIFSSTEVK